MMNAVGELVINRTRMLGRVAELERLADVLNFSKARMSDKIAEFQEKYEFNQIPQRQQLRARHSHLHHRLEARSILPTQRSARRAIRSRFAAGTPATRTRLIRRLPSSANWRWTATTSSTSCRAP